MSEAAVRAIRAIVVLAEPEEVVEGHFWAPNANGYTSAPSAERCPFCSAPMELVSAPVFGRICQEKGTRSAEEAQALVELLPASHEALSCSDEACGMVLTRLKEEGASA
jgi:hypothetical protein